MAKPTKLILITLIAIISIIVYTVFIAGPSESETNHCINNILETSDNHALRIETKGRGNIPLLKGNASLETKKNILQLIRQKCGPIKVQDFVEPLIENPSKLPTISFEIDNVNSTILINGMLNNKQEANTIIESFNNALNDQKKVFTIKHDLKTDDEIKPSEFDISITLIMPSINAVQMAKVSIKEDKLTLKGLVRDELREKETIDKLKALFADELTVINQLELVVKYEPVIEKYKFELAPLPTIEKQ